MRFDKKHQKYFSTWLKISVFNLTILRELYYPFDIKFRLIKQKLYLIKLTSLILNTKCFCYRVISLG